MSDNIVAKKDAGTISKLVDTITTKIANIICTVQANDIRKKSSENEEKVQTELDRTK